MLNGVTELLTHGFRETKKKPHEIFRTSEYGVAADQKAQALDNLLFDGRRSHTIQRGRELIENGATTLVA
jgi:hypothetical protein